MPWKGGNNSGWSSRVLSPRPLFLGSQRAAWPARWDRLFWVTIHSFNSLGIRFLSGPLIEVKAVHGFCLQAVYLSVRAKTCAYTIMSKGKSDTCNERKKAYLGPLLCTKLSWVSSGTLYRTDWALFLGFPSRTLHMADAHKNLLTSGWWFSFPFGFLRILTEKGLNRQLTYTSSLGICFFCCLFVCFISLSLSFSLPLSISKYEHSAILEIESILITKWASMIKHKWQRSFIFWFLNVLNMLGQILNTVIHILENPNTVIPRE